MMSSVSPRTDGEEPGAVLRLELERNDEAPSVARAAITGFCENRHIPAGTVSTLRLLVSEVITNAVIHPDAEATASIRLLAQRTSGTIRVEVTDQGGGFIPRPRDPAQAGDGFGLYLLEREASGWGVVRRDETTVWLEVTA